MESILELKDDEIKKLKKDALVDFVMDIKKNKNVLVLLKSMQDEIKLLRDEIQVLRSEKNQQTNGCSEEMEREHYDHMQYTRRNNVEISGIPDIFDENLEEKVIDICSSLEISVEKRDIEACHRLYQKAGVSGPKRTVVRFTNRRIVEQMMRKKKSLNTIVEEVGFPEGSSIYFNDNLCSYYRKLWVGCRKLKREGIVKFVWTVRGIVKIRRDEGSPVINICHKSDLSVNFPDFNFD